MHDNDQIDGVLAAGTMARQTIAGRTGQGGASPHRDAAPQVATRLAGRSSRWPSPPYTWPTGAA